MRSVTEYAASKARDIVRKWSFVAACILSIGVSAAHAASANRLAEIRARGTLNCGIWPHVPGFATEHDGRYVGFEVDICRAVAAAIFGDIAKARFVPLAHVTEFVERKDIDLALRRLTWTLKREARGVVFGPVVFYDGQGFLVPKTSGIKRVSELESARICVINMERHPETLRNYFRDRGRDVHLVLVESDEDAEKAVQGQRCRAYSADVTWLAAARSHFSNGVARYEILPEQISKEPLAPLMKAEDTELARLVRWTLYAMIEAEEIGVTSRNVATIATSSSRVRSFLSIHPGSSVMPSAGDWVRAIMAGVGNYGEVFDRNLGAKSPIKLERGLNRLWTDGGLMYAPPLDR